MAAALAATNAKADDTYTRVVFWETAGHEVLEEGGPLAGAPLTTPFSPGGSKRIQGRERKYAVRRKFGWHKYQMRPRIPVGASRRVDADRGVGRPKSYVFDEEAVPFDQFISSWHTNRIMRDGCLYPSLIFIEMPFFGPIFVCKIFSLVVLFDFFCLNSFAVWREFV